MSEEKYRKAGHIIVKAGMLPFPITDTLIEILRLLYTEKEIDFIIKTFNRKASQTIEELIKSSKLEKEKLFEIIEPLVKKGAVFKSKSSAGLMVYRLLPLIMVGIFEYQFMKKLEYSDHEKKIAVLFQKLFEEIREVIQDKYEMFLPVFRNIPPIDRTVPILLNEEGKEIVIEIDQDLETPMEHILPAQKIEEVIDKFDDIAVGHCFCRHHKELLGENIEVEETSEICFTLGKSARFTVEQGFARMIDKEEAMKLLRKAENAGMVHKVYHPFGNISKDETSICNCHKSYCATFELWKSGTMPMINATNYLSIIDEDLCVGCGTCVQECPVDAIELNDKNKAERNPEWCIGCGVCAHFCPENAITLQEGMRKVYVPPPRMR
jgi:ferredoxin